MSAVVVTPDGSRWVDQATGQGGGVLEFMQMALGVGACEAHWLRRSLERDIANGVLDDK